MITVKYIPNVLNSDGRIVKEFQFSRSKKLRDYLQDSGFQYQEKKIIVSGKKTEDLELFINDNDEILVIHTPKDIISGIWAIGVAIQAFVVEYAFWFKLGLFLATVGYAIYAAMQRPVLPSFGTSGEESSPTYGWDGISTTQTVGTPVPVVYGEHKVGGNIINAYISTDGDKHHLNVLLGLCEGEIDSISNIKINDNPIANFAGVSTYQRFGTNTQTVIPNFQDLHNLYSVNVQLTQHNSYTYTTVDSDVEGFKIHLHMPKGLYQVLNSGAIKAWNAVYRVEYRISGVGAYTLLNTYTIRERSRTTVRRVIEKTGLTAGKYDIRITKTSSDGNFQQISDLYVQSVDEIKTDDLAYPNTALLGFKALASEQLSGGMPNFTCNVKGKKISVPKIMNGGSEADWEDYYWNADNSEYRLLSDDTSLTWDGTTYVERWCGNPVWCLKDLLLNSRYGVGEHIDSTVIDDALYLEMSRYCEEKIPDGSGGYEKRFILDVVIDSPRRALDWISQINATFRGLSFYSEDSIKLRIDKEETPSQLFTMGNIDKDSFTQSWKSIKEVPNVIDIQFLDKDKDYKQEQIAYIDEDALADGDPMRKRGMRIFTTRLSQAVREARYALKVAKYINRTIVFKAATDALAVQPGDVISVSHDVPQWGYGGRVKNAISTTQVTVDKDLTISEGVAYSLRIRFADDTVEEKIVTNAVGTTNIITVSSAFSQTPQMYDVFTFGRTNAVKKDFRVVSIERSGRNEVTLSAVEYDENVYDDSDISIPSNNYSDLVLEIPPITSLSLTERLVLLKDGTVENAIDVWWERPTRDNYVKTFRSFRVYLSDDDGGSWNFQGETAGISFPIEGNIKDLEEYRVAVTTVDGFGEETAVSTAPSAIITPIGKSAKPDDLTSFLVNQTRDSIYFGWTEVADIDVKYGGGYEIRTGADWDSATLVRTNLKGNSYSTRDFKTGSSQKYWIKARDASGNYSETALEAQITVDNIPFQNVVMTFSEDAAWDGTRDNTAISGANLIISTGFTTGTYTTKIKDVGYVATFGIAVEVATSITQGTKFNTDGVTAFNTSATERFTGQEAPGAATFEIRTSEDNITWTSWADYQVGDYKCRYYQLRMTLTRENASASLTCTNFNHFADLPDVDEKGEERVTVAADGVGITFSKTFHEAPNLNVTIVTGNGVYYRLTDLSTTGVTAVKLYNHAGVLQTGTFRWHAHGL